jgi:PPK2 family polyphosphate:nucleotide phosphotransferase
MSSIIDGLRVKPGSKPKLSTRDTDARLGIRDKEAGREVVAELLVELDALHGRLWAEEQRSLLLVLQGMDASGKDGAIRRVLSGLNPQGCAVASFKEPTDTDLAHDYLWRVHHLCPPRGHLGAFNRSHYEDVLAARMVGAASAEECGRRYRHLREFERLLVDEGTTVVKVFLHLSPDEQRERLQMRIDDPAKNWKMKLSDLETRAQWDQYMDLYEEVIAETSTEHAPWYVVPADRKWVRDVAVATLLVETLRDMDPRIPPPDPALRGVVVK